MLACDLLLEVRASRSISRDQVWRLDRMLFGAGEPDAEGVELITLLARYVSRADASWAELLTKAAAAAARRETPRPLAA